jgi:hypothetical protein
MNPMNMNTTETNLVAANVMTPPPSTQATTAHEPAAINPRLQKWVDFLELIAGDTGPVHQENDAAPFIKDAEEIRKMNAEKRLKAKLRRLEIEQKEALYNEVMEKRARELGEEWPRMQEVSQDPRFDHIPKPWPGYEEIMAKAFPGAQTVKPEESNE